MKAFDEALGLWRGEALADVALEGDARSAVTRLDDERRAARSERVDVALALGRHNELVADLERAVAAEPLDEHALRQLMLALYRNGRQADALARYRDGRQRLVHELGIEPAAELRGLEQAILRHDPELTRPTREPTAGRTAASPATRRRLGRGVAIAASSDPSGKGPAHDRRVELRSSRELLAWLVDLAGIGMMSGAFKRGEYLVSLATAEGRMPQPPRRFADWLYELRDGDLIVFDDSDAPGDVNLMRSFAITAAGQALIRAPSL
jgi:Bacterial transcriptional activator domain